MDLPARLLGHVAAGSTRTFSWLDGADLGWSWCGLDADAEVEAESFEALDAVQRAWRADPSRVWMGWITYDLGARALAPNVPSGQLRGLCMRRFPAALQFRGDEVVPHGDAAAVRRLERRLADTSPLEEGGWPLRGLTPELKPEAYRARVESAREFIRAGDTYQVNLSQTFTASWRSERAPRSSAALARDVARIYATLRTDTPASMGALVRAGERWIVSNSPETLLDLRGGPSSSRASGFDARSWPIKGTRPRGATAEADADAIAQLQGSAKDRAEHLMIVDLVRNDLGRLATPGSVLADRVPTVVTLPTVHHLVSEVRATLRPEVGLATAVRAVFPGGSITGAPKRRTVEIIAGLEGEPREIYCGALLVLEPTGARLSIPIRTALVGVEGLWLRSGGGIVADSDPEGERQETEAKARAFDR